MSKSTQPIIIVRRKAQRGKPRNTGSWKIAYADFMTAMMAFFLVMWILSLIPRDDLKDIADYFRMPLMEAISAGYSSSLIPSDNGSNASVIPDLAPAPPALSDEDAEVNWLDVQRLEGLMREIEDLIASDPILKAYYPQLLLDMTQDGLRIQIVDDKHRPMFALGSAQVKPYMRSILRSLSGLLNEMPNAVQIAGHTDDTQYASGERHYSNWELSADRANAARQELVAGGLAENKIKQVLGMASTVNLIHDDPSAEVNRRISLTVLNREAEARIDAQNASGNVNNRDLGDLYGPNSNDSTDINSLRNDLFF